MNKNVSVQSAVLSKRSGPTANRTTNAFFSKLYIFKSGVYDTRGLNTTQVNVK